MKIAIISDWHLGVSYDTELGKDSFNNLYTAFKQLEEQNINLVLVPGDLFDISIPSPEVLFETINLLSDINIPNKLEELKTKIPMIAIIGNHEYRGKDYITTVELLESMGFLKLLKADKFSFINEKINIFGMTGVPEKYAKDYLLEKFSPQPVKGEYNLLMIHQSILEYLPFEDEMIATISLSDLPSGFDVIVNGHLHWSSVIDLPSGVKFLLPGSTVTTQIKKKETEKPKGYFIIDTETKETNFFEIKNIRQTHYIDIKFSKKTVFEILQQIKTELEKLTKTPEKKAIVRIRIKGELESGESLKNLNLNEIKKEYSDYFYISIKNDIEEKRLKESIDQLKKLQTENKNIQELAKEIFSEQIEQTKISKDFDYKRIYDLLNNGDVEKAKDILKY
ncbi:MAG: metallophosphoesterase [archaeon]|jgi:DNA repair exonuclease SbcCD nuclease subunit